MPPRARCAGRRAVVGKLANEQWHKIEHRLFSAISQDWRGKLLVGHEAIVMERALTDNGSEFRSSDFADALRGLGASQTFIHPGRPTSNGSVERVQRTILEECWRPSFARSLVPKVGGLSRDLEHYLAYYNTERAHTGRLTQGRTPWQTLIGARKMRPR